MTKAEYIDFVRNSLQMVDKTAKYHHEQVAAAINVAVNTVFYGLWNNANANLKKSFERYTTLTDVLIEYNATTKYYLSTLSVDVVDLPRKTGGIFDIIDNGSSGYTKYVPLSPMEWAQLNGITTSAEAKLPNNVVGFSFSGPRTIYFWGSDMTGSHYVKLIQQFRSYSNTDNVLLPYGQDEKIIELTRKYLGDIPPKDLINNNADVNG